MAEMLFPPVKDSSELTLECRRSDYSASTIARAVEDADAHLLNLNITAAEASDENHVRVDLRVSHRNGGSVARSLERHGYDVVDIRDGADYDSELLRNRVNELLAHIDI